MGFEISGFSVQSGDFRVSKPLAMDRPLKSDEEDYYGFPIRALEAGQIDWNGDRFRIESAHALLRDDPVRIPRVQMDLDRPELPFLKTEIHVETKHIERHLTDFGVDGLTGQVNLVVECDGELDALAARASLNNLDLPAPWGPIRNVTPPSSEEATAFLSASRPTVSKCSVSTFAQTSRLMGR